jgi:alpha,alpha-trehalase
MLSNVGLRSLAKNDPDYNNENIIIPYSNWQGPLWMNANYLYFVGLKNYGFEKECRVLAYSLGKIVAKDIENCGSMHETYDAETGAPLAPTAAQSKDGIFTGFVSWNLLVQNMLMGVVDNNWMMLEIK